MKDGGIMSQEASLMNAVKDGFSQKAMLGVGAERLTACAQCREGRESDSM